jgi:iron complex outermembrane receptor protein
VSRDAWDVLIRVNRFGEYKSYHTSNPNLDQTYSEKFITDLEISREVATGTRFAVGVNNLFDVYPDRTLQPSSNFGIFQHSGLTPFGFDGRYIYSRLTLKF